MTSAAMVTGVSLALPFADDRGNERSLLEVILRWGHTTSKNSDIASLTSLLQELAHVLQCEHFSLYCCPANGTFHRIDEAKAVSPLPASIQWTPAFRHSLLWNSPESIATELAPLVHTLPQGISHALIAPIVIDSECLGLLFVADKTRHLTSADLTLLNGIAGLIAPTLQSHTLQQQNKRAEQRRHLLDHIRSHFQRTLNLDLLIARILEEVNTAIHADAQSIWLVDEPAGLIRCRFATGPGADVVKQITVPLGEGIVGNTVARQESLLIADAQADARHSRRADRQTGITTHSLVSVPLVRDGRAIGAIQAINKQDAAAFTQEDLDLLQSIADIAALAIENARLYAELESSYDITLQALTAALDARDRETEGHSRRVVEYAVRLAQEVGMSGAELKTLRRGAMIHDIGKIGIPDAILHKPGPLTPGERTIMDRHPEIGFDMLKEVPYLDEELDLVLCHQERWDGEGYPRGLKQEEIPFFARLFAIVDCFDAIRSDRPYRKGRSCETAREIIATEAGCQFDPDLVTAFLKVPTEDWEAIRRRCAR